MNYLEGNFFYICTFGYSMYFKGSSNFNSVDVLKNHLATLGYSINYMSVNFIILKDRFKKQRPKKTSLLLNVLPLFAARSIDCHKIC